MKRIAIMCAVLLASALCAAPTLEQLIADPQLWPAEVTVAAATRATVIRDGKPGGVMLVGAGKKLVVTGIALDGVTGKLGGTTVRIPVDKTNLLQGPAPAVEAAVAAEPAPEPAVPAAPAPAAPTRIQRELANKLVRLDGGKLTNINTDQTLAGVKYYAFYYSASWCGPCRQFTPGFIQAYRELKKRYPQFEVVFVSNDHSAGDMAGYMKHDNMPWPALKYELAENSPLQRYAGPGIPCLVLVDGNGKVLADSFQGENYLGPGHVLQQTQRILAKEI